MTGCSPLPHAPEMLPEIIQTAADLSALNTLALPARAEFLATIHQYDQLLEVIRHPDLAGRRRFVLGGGSNLVLTGDFSGLVIQMALKGRELVSEDEQAWYVAANAGENWHEFVQWTLAQGWPGLENLSLIPGTVGAAPIQNIGAYGLEVSELLDHVEAVDLQVGRRIRFDNKDCVFDYRSSLFKQENWHLSGRYAITRVIFRLPKLWRARTGYGEVVTELAKLGARNPTPQQMSQAICAIRERKLPDPSQIPNAGSFFQNPVVSQELAEALASAHPQLPRYPQPNGRIKLAAGWLIEQAGWKGRNLGPVGMYEQQALVLVNRGGAKSRDVQALTRAVREAVLARFGVNLQPEPVFL